MVDRATPTASLCDEARTHLRELRAVHGAAPLSAAVVAGFAERLAPRRLWLPAAGGGLGLRDGAALFADLGEVDAGLALACLPGVYAPGALARLGAAERRRVADQARDGGSTVALGGALSGAGDVALSGQDDADHLLNGSASTVHRIGPETRLLVGARSADERIHLLSVGAAAPGVRVVERELGAAGSLVLREVVFADCRARAASADAEFLFCELAVERFLLAAIRLGVTRRLRDLCMAHGQDRAVNGRKLIFSVPFAARLGQVQMLIDAAACTLDLAGADEDQLADEDEPAGAALLGLVEAVAAVEPPLAASAAACAQACGVDGRMAGSPILRASSEAEVLAALAEGELAAALAVYERRVLPEARGLLY